MNNIVVATSKPKAKRNKTVFNFYVLDSPPLTPPFPHEKIKQVSFFFSTLGFIAPIKYMEQNVRENIVQCWFYGIIIENPTPTFAEMPPKF